MTPPTALEDELGDVLEKGMKYAGLSVEKLAEKSGISPSKIMDAVDYRYDLDDGEVARLAHDLDLNEVGLCALSQGRYPLPELPGLPFILNRLPMPFGVGSVNAYLLVDPCTHEGLLFDAGNDFAALEKAWPRCFEKLAAIFLTHGDGDHVGGLEGVLSRHGDVPVYGPRKRSDQAGQIEDGREFVINGFHIRSYATPGHVPAHNSYLVSSAKKRECGKVLVSGDLFFAGSVGGAFSSPEALLRNARRMWREMEPRTVVAPGHGPLTNIETERRFNPFSHGSS